MKFFWRYIFPALFGLVIYTSIRLVTDLATGEQFWQRSWKQNSIEVVFVLAMAFAFEAILRYFMSRFRKRNDQFSLKSVLKEFAELLIVCFAFINPVLFLIHYLINDPVGWDDFAIANIIVALYILLYYAIARGNNFIRAFIQQQLQLEKIRNDQLNTELKFLKGQYHPHFLFNALNTIYFQMDESVPAAKKSIEQFSELLRYQLYDQQQMVPVSKEIDYLKTYISLQKERMNQNLRLDLHFDDQLNGQQVYPLLFMPLVENAFKYTGGDYWIKISATKNENGIDFIVENSIPQNPIPVKEGGIGLENLKRRLELLYPHHHALQTDKTAHSFKAFLKLST